MIFSAIAWKSQRQQTQPTRSNMLELVVIIVVILDENDSKKL